MKLLDTLAKRLGYTRTTKAPQKRFKAGGGGRLLADWSVQRTALNQLIQSGLVATRARTRELCRDDPYMKGFIGLCKRNIVGPEGVKLETNIVDDNGLKDRQAEAKIKAAWAKFCRQENFSVTGDMSFFEFQELIATDTPQSGEYLVRFVDGADNPFNFAIQVIDPDCLDENYHYNFSDGRFIRMGVEFNRWKKPIAYHIFTQNPYDSGYGGTLGVTRERIDARDIAHGFVRLGVNQVRGMPWPHAAIIKTQMLDGYEEAALVHARSAACQMGFLQKSLDAGGSMPHDDEETDENGEQTGNGIIEQEPGIIRELDPGVTFQGWNPNHPNAEHGPFIKSGLRAIATALSVSYNALANDLESVNYSSIRAGSLDERDGWKMVHRWLIDKLYNRIYERFLFASMNMKGILDLPPRKFDKFNQPAFCARTWAWVDPEKDITASILAIENGLTTRTDVIASSSGGSLEENFDTLQHEQQLAKEKGLEFTGLAGSKAKMQAPPKAAV